MVKSSDVFIAGGFPAITYISRDEYQLESTIVDYLDARHKILSISGSTKSGKTVLVLKILPKGSCFWIAGGQVKDLNSFWEIVLGKTGAYTSISDTTTENKNTLSGRMMTASAKPAGIGADITSQFSENNQHEASQTLSRTIHPTYSAINQLVNHMLPLVIDDFHYIYKDIQTSIIRSLKEPVFEGLPVILITVPNRSYDVRRVEKEMTGRVKQLQISAWETNELEKIAELGFKALNVQCTPEIIKKMAKESFDSPHLMQEFCLTLCRENGIKETQPSLIPLQEPDDWPSFFRKMDANLSKVAFERLARGPRQRTDRIDRMLVNGETCDIYTAVLLVIAWTGPKTTLTYEDIRTGLRAVLKSDSIPQGSDVMRILKIMSKIAKDIEGEPVVDWDSDTAYLHISDPFFAYYLKWGVLVPTEK
jgi:hypothetical protein